MLNARLMFIISILHRQSDVSIYCAKYNAKTPEWLTHTTIFFSIPERRSELRYHRYDPSSSERDNAGLVVESLL